MKGWTIFLHAYHQLSRNLEGALRLSLAPYLVMTISAYFILGGFSGVQAEFASTATDHFLLRTLFVTVLTVVVSAWIAVAWHRFILLGHEPEAYFPRVPADLVWSYILRSLVLTSIAGVFFVILVLLANTIGDLINARSWILSALIFGVFVWFPLAFFCLRLFGSFPGPALGKATDAFASWVATAHAGWDIAVLAALIVLTHVFLTIFTFVPYIGPLVSVVNGWVLMMFWASILTTIFGHFIEGRVLD